MIFIETQDKYIEAAKILANCKPSRLPYVLAALKQGGIDLGNLSAIQEQDSIPDGRARWLRSERENFSADWDDTTDEAVIALRRAYSNGLNISKFSHLSGIGRTTLYKILQTGTISTSAYRSRILTALKSL